MSLSKSITTCVKSKTAWGGILFLLGTLMNYFPATAPFSPVVDALAVSLGFVGGRLAIEKLLVELKLRNELIAKMQPKNNEKFLQNL